jgi:hypothetical protein
MDGAPVASGLESVEEEFDGALAAPGKAIVDFLGLFGNMDVDRRFRIDGGKNAVEQVVGDGTQAVWRDTKPAERAGAANLLQGFVDFQKSVDAIDEAALASGGGCPPKPP